MSDEYEVTLQATVTWIFKVPREDGTNSVAEAIADVIYSIDDGIKPDDQDWGSFEVSEVRLGDRTVELDSHFDFSKKPFNYSEPLPRYWIARDHVKQIAKGAYEAVMADADAYLNAEAADAH